MLPGDTALSEEISTKRSAPTRTAASRSRAVPMMLFVTASSGFASMSGTCLCAAAWKTTAGRTRSNSSRIRPPSRMSAMTDCSSSAGNTRRSSASMSKMLFSPWPDEHEAARLGHRHLPAELRADRPARAGDEHDLIDDVVEDRVLVPDRLALQQVGDLDVAQPPDRDPVAEELVDSRQDLRRHVEPPAGLRQHADRAAGRGRHRDHDLLDAVLLDDALERVHRSEHRQARDPLAVLHDGIVEKPDDVQAELRIALRFPGDHGARAARAHDQHALPRGRAGIPALEEAPLRFAEHAYGKPRAAGERHRQAADRSAESIARTRRSRPVARPTTMSRDSASDATALAMTIAMRSPTLA